ncbi:MAG: Thymidylate kinase [Alphaproteobacteria bacterium MarineAlpha3_Bin5]|nr:MAG: Thymidylate kinase [Alphaproteobacteria bacterium MarineAlpha3_Bin5]
MRSGYFITFEGGEGVGKSTQISQLDSVLRSKGIKTFLTREPGGSIGAEKIRELIVTGRVDRWTPLSELLMLYAARVDHITKSIKPALEQGKWVLCDRFFDSTFVYQGYGHNLSQNIISELHELAVGDFKPDLTLVLDINIEEGFRRTSARNSKKTSKDLAKEDRYERMDHPFHNRIRKGFLEIAEKNSNRAVVVDASGNKKTVFNSIVRVLETRLGYKI